MPHQHTPWLLREPAADAPARIFCLPYSGVGASVFRRWPRRIGPLEVCPLQPPGRENRISHDGVAGFGEFGGLAADALRPYLDRPYAVFGHCMGALLAHSLVTAIGGRELRPPTILFVSSSRVPHWPPERRYRLPAPGATGVYHPSMTNEQLAEQVSKVSTAVGQGELHPDLVPIALRVLRADLDMCFNYAPPGPVRTVCPITTIAWDEDVDVRAEEMLAWQECGPVVHRTAPGSKLTFLDAPPELLRIIDDDFATASAAVPAQ